MELTGAQALIKSLEMCDVEVLFGLPGGAILPVYDPILDSKSDMFWFVMNKEPAIWRRATHM